MYVYLDKIENGFASFLFGEREQYPVSLPISLFDSDLREGTWLKLDFCVDEALTRSYLDKVERVTATLGDNP